MSSEQTTGRQLRLLREAAGMSQADLAEALGDGGLDGFYPQTIVKIEQGRRQLKFEEGVAIAALFGVEAEAMIPGATWSEEAIEMRRRARALQEAHAHAHGALLDLQRVEREVRGFLELLEPGTFDDYTEAWLKTSLRVHSVESTIETFRGQA